MTDPPAKSASGALTLQRSQDAQGLRYVGARYERGAGLTIEGHDLGSGVEAFFGEGNTEYEWETTVAEANLPRLLAELGAGPDTPVLEALAARFRGKAAHTLRQWLEEKGLAGPGWTRIGD